MDQAFKEKPVLAFSGLLTKSLLFIFTSSLAVSVPFYFLLRTLFSSALGSGGSKKLASIFSTQAKNPEEFMKQSELLQKFIAEHQGFVPIVLFSVLLGVLLMVYIFCITQLYVKNNLMAGTNRMLNSLLPGKPYLTISLFLIILSVILFFSGGVAALLMAGNPLPGILFLALISMLVIRRVLVIPGILIGEMTYSEAIAYSFQTISTGKAFKILLFGLIVFLFLSMCMSVIFYLPSNYIKDTGFRYFLNFWLAFIQVGFISMGMVSLFLRYGTFKEEKIT